LLVTDAATGDAVVRDPANAVRELVVQAVIGSLVVSGGASTPIVLRQVAESWTSNQVPVIIVSDERHTTDVRELNSEQLRTAVHGTPLAAAHIVTPPTSSFLLTSAREWSSQLAEIAPSSLALMSMADDSHVASIFPMVDAEAVNDALVLCRASPKPPFERISLSMDYLRGLPHRFVIVIGREKSATLTAVARGADLPISRLAPTCWFVESSLVPAVR
jgi:6-phosphogluconolactonase/glucosamine-6-phosphate isomerase/deaminase